MVRSAVSPDARQYRKQLPAARACLRAAEVHPRADQDGLAQRALSAGDRASGRQEGGRAAEPYDPARWSCPPLSLLQYRGFGMAIRQGSITRNAVQMKPGEPGRPRIVLLHFTAPPIVGGVEAVIA